MSDDEVSTVYVQTYDADSPKSDKENNHTELRNSKLRLNEIRESELRQTELRNSDLRQTELRNSDVRQNELRNSDLRHSELRGSELRSQTLLSSQIEPMSTYEDANTSDSITSHISDSGEPRLVFIDFEYCAYNYRGFDIANHFQEWGYDYTNSEHPFYYENQDNCPTLEQKVSVLWYV
jgi:thiamine kinase-like enzyme